MDAYTASCVLPATLTIDNVASSNRVPGERGSLHADDSRDKAAELIQRNYRGYRERRQLNGMGLDASTRWLEAVKEAQYRNATRPRPRREWSETPSIEPATGVRTEAGFARQKWREVRHIAHWAAMDDTSESDDDMGTKRRMTDAQLEEYHRKKLEAKRKREQNAKMMGLEYFLEMVDHKHRYGSHLRSYHAIWKQADTTDGFFHWLDEGDGKHVETQKCSREKLDKHRVRYLSREQRQKYLVRFDDSGRLHWAKNSERVTTSHEYKDSMDGIVRSEELARAWDEEVRSRDEEPHRASRSPDEQYSSPDSSESEDKQTNGQARVVSDVSQIRKPERMRILPAAAFLDRLVKYPTKSGTWIFVVDTSFRLYIGIKQSGAFQHSSFLRGARISAAGQIKVKDGQLRRLSPLSGHYRPPASNFHAFVHSLKENGVDLSRVNISRSYAVLLGTESYIKTKKGLDHRILGIEKSVGRILRPDEARKREESETDKSQSAKREREFLEEKRRQKEHERGEGRKRMLGFPSKALSPTTSGEQKP